MNMSKNSNLERVRKSVKKNCKKHEHVNGDCVMKKGNK